MGGEGETKPQVNPAETGIESGSIDSLKSMHQTIGIKSCIVMGMFSFLRKRPWEIVSFTQFTLLTFLV